MASHEICPKPTSDSTTRTDTSTGPWSCPGREEGEEKKQSLVHLSASYCPYLWSPPICKDRETEAKRVRRPSRGTEVGGCCLPSCLGELPGKAETLLTQGLAPSPGLSIPDGLVSPSP